LLHLVGDLFEMYLLTYSYMIWLHKQATFRLYNQ